MHGGGDTWICEVGLWHWGRSGLNGVGDSEEVFGVVSAHAVQLN